MGAASDDRLWLNPTAQKNNRGVLGASLLVEQLWEIVGYSNMVDYTNHIICGVPVVKLC